jgi:hypothetical protein
MKPILQLCFLFVVLNIGCTKQQDEIEAIREETGKALFGDADDLRYKLSIYVYDQEDEESPAKSEEFPEPTPEMIQEKVSGLPWTDQRYSISASVGQGTIWLPNHRILSVSANAELESGALEPLTATVNESVEDGKRIEKRCRLPSPKIIAELLTAYLNQDGEHQNMVDWETVR